MTNTDSDLLDRLRKGALHKQKQVAKTLSEISKGASKKALRAPRSAVGELRSLVDEIQRRLPSATTAPSATGQPPGPGAQAPGQPRRPGRDRAPLSPPPTAKPSGRSPSARVR